MGYFKKVTFIFLIVGHTKNAADRLFNLLKKLYRLENIFTMPQLIAKLRKSDHVTVHETSPRDFFDYDSFLSKYYTSLTGKIKKNHIFSCSYEKNFDGKQLKIELRESDLDEHKVEMHNSIKQKFYGRDKYAMGQGGWKEAVTNRPKDIKSYRNEQLQNIEPPGINIYKRVEMGVKYRPCINDEEALADPLYAPPRLEELEVVNKEKKKRKKFRKELNEEKRVAAKDIEVKKLDVDEGIQAKRLEFDEDAKGSKLGEEKKRKSNTEEKATGRAQKVAKSAANEDVTKGGKMGGVPQESDEFLV